MGIGKKVVLATKAGRHGFNDFDFFRPNGSVVASQSLRRLRTDHIDVLQLHDVEFVPLAPLIHASIPELVKMRDEGLVRAIGVTGYPPAPSCAALRRGTWTWC